LTRTFAKFIERPDKLQLVQGENYTTERKVEVHEPAFQVEDVIHIGKLVSTMQSKLLEVQKEQEEATKAETAKKEELEKHPERIEEEEMDEQ